MMVMNLSQEDRPADESQPDDGKDRTDHLMVLLTKEMKKTENLFLRV